MRRTYSPPEVMTGKCTGCGLCVEVCPAFVFAMTNKKASVVRGDWCINCGQCGAVCPEGAILHEATAFEKGPRPGPRPALSPEQLMLLLRERRSVRLYRDEAVPKTILERIIAAGRYAPTGSNSQNVHYVALESLDEIAQLQEMTIAFYAKVFARVKGRFGAFLFRVFVGRRIVEHLQESIPKVEHAKELMDQGKACLFYHAPAVMVVHAESWDSCSAFHS